MMSAKFRGPVRRAHAVRVMALALVAGASAMGLLNFRALAATGSGASTVLVANLNCSGITSYPATANGDVLPIAGGGLCDPDSIAFDSAGNIYVSNPDSGAILVFPKGSKGHARPTAVINGDKTGLRRPFGIALDRSQYLCHRGSGRGDLCGT